MEMREAFGRVEGHLDVVLARQASDRRRLDEIKQGALTPRFREKVVTKSFFEARFPSPAEKKKARREDRRLAELELELDDVQATPFARGGQGEPLRE